MAATRGSSIPLGGMAKNRGSLEHLDHERALAQHDLVAGTNTREHSVDNRQPKATSGRTVGEPEARDLAELQGTKAPMWAKITANSISATQPLRVQWMARTREAGRPHERTLSAHIRARDQHGARFSETQRDIIGNNYTGGGPVVQTWVSHVFEVDNTAVSALPLCDKLWEACRATR